MIEKHLADDRLYDFLFESTLPNNDTITGVIGTSSDLGLSFGTGVVNSSPATYSDGSVQPIGTVIQIRISGGTLDSNQTTKIGKLRIQFSTVRDTLVEAVFNMTLRK